MTSVVETHISRVFLTDDRAFKVKKPVTLPFLDYGTLDRRREACEREVELNRRLAPDLYLGVRALLRDPVLGLALAPADAEGAVEYAVEMRRFSEDDTLAGRISTGAVDADDLLSVGAWLARFHERAEVTRIKGAEPVKRTLDDTFATLLGLGRALPRLERFASAFLSRHACELDDRAARGCVRDGHGDLRAEHVLLGGPVPAAVDCIEFSDALRRVDVGADLAFLVMDLMRFGRDDLAEALVVGYRDAGGDPGDDALIWFHAMARALVRAKVALLRAQQLGLERSPDADELVALAHRLAWAARGRLLIAVVGLPAAGKSTLASAIAHVSGFDRLESDAVRKELGDAIYDRDHDDATYAEVLRRAAPGGVVIAATFRRARHRTALVRTAAEGGARLLVIECVVPVAELRRRIVARAAAKTDISDADLAVLELHLRDRVSFADLAPEAHLPLRADRPTEALLRAVEDALDQPPGVMAPRSPGGSPQGRCPDSRAERPPGERVVGDLRAEQRRLRHGARVHDV